MTARNPIGPEAGLLSSIAEQPRFVPSSLPIVRWGFLAALLVVEVLGLSLSFSTTVYFNDGRWWARLIGQSGMVLRLGTAATVATALFQGGKLRAELGKGSTDFGRLHRWRTFLLAHLVSFAAFAVLTAVILGNGPDSLFPSPSGGFAIAEAGWSLAWAVVGLATLVLWCGAVLPPLSWVPLARAAGGAISIGVGVGSLALIAGQLTNLLWQPLSIGTFATVAMILKSTGLEVVSRPEVLSIGTTSFRVRIAPACSGYEGIGLIWVFLGSYLWLLRRELRFPRAFLLLVIGTVLIWLANSLRIAALVIVGTYGSRAVAISGFHSNAGWLMFNLVGLGLVIGSHRSRFFRIGADPLPEKTGANLSAAYLGPLLALLGTMLVTGAFSAGFDRLYPLRILASAVVLWLYRGEYTDLRRTWSWAAVAIGVLVFVLWKALEPAPTSASPLTSWLAGLPRGWAAAWEGVRVAGSTIVVPLAEELAFRSFLIRRLISSDFTDVTPGRFTWTSFVISSVLFGALHGRWLAGILAGVFYAFALYRRREVSDAVVAHATTNALIAGYVLATGSWSMWT